MGIDLGWHILLSTGRASGAIYGHCTYEKIQGVWRKAGQDQYSSAEVWKNGNCRRSLHGGCLAVEEALNKFWTNQAPTKKKEITCSPSLRTESHKCNRKNADRALLKNFPAGQKSGKSFLEKRSLPWKIYRHGSSAKENCWYRKIWTASPKGLASGMHNCALRTRDKAVF